MSSANSTQDLQWLLTRKTSSFLVKQKGLGRVFTREPNNLAQIHSYRYSGLVNDKNVSVEASKNGKGIVVSTRKAGVADQKVAGARKSQTVLKGGPRHKVGAVAQIVGKDGYRSDLLKAAVARASAISRSQAPGGRKQPPAKKTRGTGARKVALL